MTTFVTAYTPVKTLLREAWPGPTPPTLLAFRSFTVRGDLVLTVLLPTRGEELLQQRVSEHFWLRYSQLTQEPPDLNEIANLARGISFRLPEGETITRETMQAELEEKIDVNHRFADRLVSDVLDYLRRQASEVNDDPTFEEWTTTLEDYYCLEWSLIQAICKSVMQTVLPVGRIHLALAKRCDRSALGGDHRDAIAETCPVSHI